MSIPVLIQAYDEVRRLAIAGSAVAPGDFRLKKLVPPLEQAGQKAPVFARVAEAIGRLVESTEQTSASALLELAALVNSILYTQGETGLPGELTPLPTVDLGGPRTQASARVLKPLLEALTTTGSGRYEVIRDGIQQGAFRDLRLIAPALRAIDDGYAEIADLVVNEILPLYGKAIVPELQVDFGAKGSGGQVRRLRLMHRLDPEAARPFVLRSLEERTPELRVAAIGCLGDAPEDLPLLLEQAKSRSRDVRAAALKALGKCGADEAARALCDAIRRDALDLAVESLQQSRHPAVTDALLDEAEAQFQALIAGNPKDAKTLGQQIGRMGLLLGCLRGREDARTEALLLAMFEDRGRLSAIKGTPGGGVVVDILVSVMAGGPPKVLASLIEARETLSPDGLGQAFAAARRSRTPAEVFAMFSPYLTAKLDEKKKANPAVSKRECIILQLKGARHWDQPEAREAPAPIDPRWLDIAVELGRLDFVRDLARPGHTGANQFLATLLRQRLGKAGHEHDLCEVLDVMAQVGHPETTDAIIEAIRWFARTETTYAYYGFSHRLARLIPALPRDEALPRLEALLPTLPEKMADQLLDPVAELKRGAPTATST